MKMMMKVVQLTAVFFLCCSIAYFVVISAGFGNHRAADAGQRKSRAPFITTTKRPFIPQHAITNLFISSKPVMKKNVEKISVPYSVKGIAQTSSGERFAIIELDGTHQQLVKEKDTIEEWAVKSINRENQEICIVNKQGAQQILKRKEDFSLPAKQKTSFQNALQETHDGNWVIKREALTEVSSDLNSLLRNVRIIPHFNEGKPSGYFLTNIKKKSIVEQAGFKNGDVILSINGNSLSNFSDLVKIYTILQKENTITVDMKRNGKQVKHHYRISD